MKTIRVLLNIAVITVMFLAGLLLGRHNTTVAHAQGAGTVPKAWGHCVGTLENKLIFEDEYGVIRVVEWNPVRFVGQVARN